MIIKGELVFCKNCNNGIICGSILGLKVLFEGGKELISIDVVCGEESLIIWLRFRVFNVWWRLYIEGIINGEKYGCLKKILLLMVKYLIWVGGM